MSFTALLERHAIVAGYREYARVTDLERWQRMDEGG